MYSISVWMPESKWEGGISGRFRFCCMGGAPRISRGLANLEIYEFSKLIVICRTRQKNEQSKQLIRMFIKNMLTGSRWQRFQYSLKFSSRWGVKFSAEESRGLTEPWQITSRDVTSRDFSRGLFYNQQAPHPPRLKGRMIHPSLLEYYNYN